MGAGPGRDGRLRLTFGTVATGLRPMKRTLVLLVTMGSLLAGAAVSRAAEFKVSEFTFTAPEKWESVETRSQMRKAQLTVPNPDGEPGEVVFFHFGPGGGGGTQANVDRWFRQFQGSREDIKARTEEDKAGTRKVTYVFAEGTYMSGLPGGPQTPKRDYALVGAIIEDPAGNIFVRMTGPKELVASATAQFKEMIGGAKAAR